MKTNFAFLHTFPKTYVKQLYLNHVQEQTYNITYKYKKKNARQLFMSHLHKQTYNIAYKYITYKYKKKNTHNKTHDRFLHRMCGSKSKRDKYHFIWL